MTIDATVPLGTELISNLDNRDREERVEINALWSAVSAMGWTTGLLVASIRETEMEAGQVNLVTGTGVTDIPFEIIRLTGAAAVDLENITGARAGQVKLFKLEDGNVTMKYDATKIDMHGDQDLACASGDVVWLCNIGGDPDAGTDGTWFELMRHLAV